MLFEAIQNECETTIPILLVDVSGSTLTNTKSGNSIMKREFLIAQQLCKNKNISKAHVICWSDTAILYENYEVDKLTKLTEPCEKMAKGTTLVSGLKLIKRGFFEENKRTNIIIVTDGEINDRSKNIRCELDLLSEHNINIQIIAVEKGEKNYLTKECHVGNALFTIIRYNHMSRFINRFSIYNDLDIEFVNFSNPIVPDGYIPFREMMFKKSNIASFLSHFSELVQEISQSKDEPKIIKSKYLKLAHELSLSIYYMTKSKEGDNDKLYHYRMSLIDLFSGVFKDSNDMQIYADVRSLLLDEISNHISGTASTFTDIRKARQQEIENVKLSLMNDVKTSICDVNMPVYESMFGVSFLIQATNDTHRFHIIKSSRNLTAIKMDKTVYKNSGVSVGNENNSGIVPIMPKPSANKECRTAAFQWLILNYSRVFNIAPSNVNLIYYFLVDALIVLGLTNNRDLPDDIKDIYKEYAKIMLTVNFGNDKPLIEKVITDMKVFIPIDVLESCLVHAGFKDKIRPFSLMYLLVDFFMVPFLKESQKNSFVESLQKYCLDSIKSDLNIDSVNNSEDNESDKGGDIKLGFDPTLVLLEKLSGTQTKINLIFQNENDVLIINKHKFGTSDVDCVMDLAKTEKDCCNVCGAYVPITVVKATNKDNEKIVDSQNINKKTFYFDTKNHVVLDGLTGESQDNELVIPTEFKREHDSVEISNITIIDPISCASLKVNNHQEFTQVTNQKYPFLKDLDMSNVVLAGGFVRSILLKQQMKDFDFFFYGLDNYSERFKTFTIELMNRIKTYSPGMKFGMFFKPLFNVFELVCYEDPTSHIDVDFTLENFDKYKFKTLKNLPTGGNKNLSQNDEYYFEDGDAKGVKMVYRIQFVLCKYQTISDIFNSFDLFPCQVAYDGKQVYFTKKSLIAYQFMINEIKLDGGSCLSVPRINKYFRYGFAIVFPPNNRDWETYTKTPYTGSEDEDGDKDKDEDEDEDKDEDEDEDGDGDENIDENIDGKIDGNNENNKNNENEKNEKDNKDVSEGTKQGKYPDPNRFNSIVCMKARKLSFEVRSKIGNLIYISHGSNFEHTTERNNELEKQALKKGESLYLSSMFCSFVSLLRYIKINDIAYLFPKYEDGIIQLPINDDAEFTFKNQKLKIYFIDAHHTLYITRDWYQKFYNSIILNDH